MPTYLIIVIPAQAGIQLLSSRGKNKNMDSGYKHAGMTELFSIPISRTLSHRLYP